MYGRCAEHELLRDGSDPPQAPSNGDVPVHRGSYRDDLDAIDAKGHVPVLQDPGLGVEIDLDWVEMHRAGFVEYGT